MTFDYERRPFKSIAFILAYTNKKSDNILAMGKSYSGYKPIF